ncbi:MAG: hypothetical protein HQ402_00245 [Parcubacteria group bacterium]|nr:hypothetical protein [Parcubacteria group bacterium]
MNNFIIHGCEQVLRFSRAQNWNDLSEERKVQLGFNMGVISLGLDLSKEEGYLVLANVREGSLPIQEFHKKMRILITSRNIIVDEMNVNKPF